MAVAAGILSEILTVTSPSLNNDMLTIEIEIDKTITQKNYDEIVSNLEISTIQCSCGAIGEFTKHGRYVRHVVLSTGEEIELSVIRVYCKHCHRTHAILLSTIVPYSKYLLSLQADIIESHERGASLDSIPEKHPEIEVDTVKSIIKKYRRYWRERLLSMKVALYPLTRLIEESFKHFRRQFMQIKTTRNKLIPSPT